MASALIGGLIRAGQAPHDITVLDPDAGQRARIDADFGVRTLAAADASLADAALAVWAVKPQFFGVAAAPCAPWLGAALHLSVMAGIRSDTIASAMGLAPALARIVRSMPNTPALIGRGIAGLFATAAVSDQERARVERVLARGPRGLERRRRERDEAAVCRICGGHEVAQDEVRERGVFRLARCLRCEHRWTERGFDGFATAARPRRANGA